MELCDFLLLALITAARVCPSNSCTSHADCDGLNDINGYCREYSSSNFCRHCGGCRYDGAPWPADALGGCPSKCDALPPLYANGTVGFFNAAPYAVDVSVGLSYEASCDLTDEATTLIIAGAAPLSWSFNRSAAWRADDRYGDTNYYCARGEGNATTYAWHPELVFLVASAPDGDLVLRGESFGDVRADKMDLAVANALDLGDDDWLYVEFDVGGLHGIGAGTVGDATVETTPETGYAAADGEQFTIEAAAECTSVCDPVCDAYDCDVRATVTASAAYGAVLACAVYGDWALSCASLSGPAQSVEGGGGDDGDDDTTAAPIADDVSGAASAAPSLLLLGWVLAYS